MAGFSPETERLVRELSAVSLLLAAKCSKQVPDNCSDLQNEIQKKVQDLAVAMCDDVKRQMWTRASIEDVTGAICILGNEDAIRALIMEIPKFSIVSFDRFLTGFSLCDRDLLYQIFLDFHLFRAFLKGPKKEFLLELWFRAIEDIQNPTDIEQAIALCLEVPGTRSLQVACGFNPEIALREINPYTVSPKALRRLFALVNAEKHGEFLNTLFAEDNPLQLPAALRLASVQHDGALSYLVRKAVLGDEFERNSAGAGLSNYSKDAVRSRIVQFVNGGTFSLDQVAGSNLGGYVDFGEASDLAGFMDYVRVVLAIGRIEQKSFVVNQISRHGNGNLFRGELVGLLQHLSADHERPIRKMAKVYEALANETFFGVVIWFDEGKQFGNLWCEETQQFYFFRLSEVEQSTVPRAHETFYFRVCSTSRPKRDFIAVNVKRGTIPRDLGVIERLDPTRGFGLIRRDGGVERLFFHFAHVPAEITAALATGLRVSFLKIPRTREAKDFEAVAIGFPGTS